MTTQLSLHKTPYIPTSFQKKNWLSIAQAFRNIHFCNMPNSPKQNLYPSFIFVKIWSCPSQTFSYKSTFYHISVFLTVSEICNISNKYWIPSNPAKKIFLHNATFVYFEKKQIALSIAKSFKKHQLFTTFLQYLKQITNS